MRKRPVSGSISSVRPEYAVASTQVGFVPRQEPPQRAKRAPCRGFARSESLLPAPPSKTTPWHWKRGFGEKPHWICAPLEVTRPVPDTVTSTKPFGRRGTSGSGGGG